MRKALVLSLGVLFAASVFAAFAAVEKGKIELKTGDEVYACACGDSCPCLMISRNAGNCGCGKPMEKAKVVSVSMDTAVLMFGQRAQTFKTVGKFMCACPGCKCDSISQTAAKCPCGVDMVAVK